MSFPFVKFRPLLLLPVLFSNAVVSTASEWRTVQLPARPLNIVENSSALWVCGADGLIAVSADGGTTWAQKHLVKNGNLLLTMGFVDEQFGYASGTGGEILFTKDGGNTWDSRKAPADVVYEAAFYDERHGIIHTAHAVYFTADGAVTWTSVPIDLASDDLKHFSHVLSVVAVDPKQMAIVLSEGNSSVYAYKLLLTKDGGANWSAHDIPSTGLGKLSAHAGEYWFAGMEVIEKDKPGGGYGVPLIMHSADADSWTKLPRWSKHEFSECNSQGCLYWDGAGVQLPLAGPLSFWTFPAEKTVTATWAFAKGNICSVSTELRCAVAATTQTMPPDVDNPSPIRPPVSAPPLNAPPTQGVQCLFCDFERIMVTHDFQGVAEVRLKLQIGQNGLVEHADVLHATNAGIGERVAATVRTWIFLPFVKNGSVHPVNTEINLKVQAIRSK
jgi:Photosynthesis system II assembly factor YCF48